MKYSIFLGAIFICLLMFPCLANTQLTPPPEGNFPDLSNYISFLGSVTNLLMDPKKGT